MILMVFLRLNFPDNLPSSEPQPKAGIRVIDSLLRVILPLILIAGVFLSLEFSFFWIPSLSRIYGRSKGQMIWSWNHFFIPERTFRLEFEEAYFILRRKRSSFSGLLLKELVMEVHLSQDTFYFKDISDFIHKEKVIQTATDQIIVKTVKLEHLPLNILQIQMLLNSVKPLS